MPVPISGEADIAVISASTATKGKTSDQTVNVGQIACIAGALPRTESQGRRMESQRQARSSPPVKIASLCPQKMAFAEWQCSLALSCT
ncbi:unnamed protein product [Lampetra fluviatilis]